jgi:dTDP-4-dehydrorhamnose 3,5-epimerase-like enzyme
VAGVEIHVLAPEEDDRGRTYSMPSLGEFLTRIADLHAMTIRPGAVRGNHFHRHKREALIVHFADRWELRCDAGEGTDVDARQFGGEGAVALLISPGCAHALRNTGAADIVVVAASDRPHDPANPDAAPRALV